MLKIHYGLHFSVLFLAALLLSVSSVIFEKIPSGEARFLAWFGFLGTLHATALVISLRRGTAIALRVAFVALATVLSAMTMTAMIVLTPVLALIPGDTPRFYFLLAMVSAIGTSAYWLSVRWFWLKTLRFGDYVRAVGLCVAATLLSWTVASLLMLMAPAWAGGLPASPVRDIANLLPPVTWWAAFSASLYWSELWAKAKESNS